jgi:hypothetical protein
MNVKYRAPDRAIDCGILLPPTQQAGSREPRRDELPVVQVPGAENVMRKMRKGFVWVACATILVMTSGTASAQYRAGRGATSGVSGEDYHVELAYALWNPTPDIQISSESLGIVGSTIDGVVDLGFEKSRFHDFRVVLRPSRKFKFRFGVTPIKYEGDTTLTRTIVFNGQRYTVGLPVTSLLEWKSWRFGIEYDFIARPGGFLGFIVEAKYTDLNVELAAPIIAEFTQVKVPIPTIGAIGRVYVTENFAITGELTGLKLTIQEDTGKYLEFDLNAMFNFTPNLGVQGGYRTLSLDYDVEQDFGNMDLKGLYFGGVARF